eukprot:6207651-Pleurochrysis_carterae.AAC.6
MPDSAHVPVAAVRVIALLVSAPTADDAGIVDLLVTAGKDSAAPAAVADSAAAPVRSVAASAIGRDGSLWLLAAETLCGGGIGAGRGGDSGRAIGVCRDVGLCRAHGLERVLRLASRVSAVGGVESFGTVAPTGVTEQACRCMLRSWTRAADSSMLDEFTVPEAGVVAPISACTFDAAHCVVCLTVVCRSGAAFGVRRCKAVGVIAVATSCPQGLCPQAASARFETRPRREGLSIAECVTHSVIVEASRKRAASAVPRVALAAVSALSVVKGREGRAVRGRRCSGGGGSHDCVSC